MTVGFQLVIKTSLFFAGYNSKKTVKNIEDATVLVEPTIDNLPDATSSAKISIEGTSSENTLIEIYVNEDKKDELETTDGTFSTEVTLDPGENIVYVRAQNEKKVVSKDSQLYKVIYVNKAPELLIDSPADGAEVDKEEITISGSVSDNTTIKVNGLPTIVTASGTFSRAIQLTEGENTITVLATDIANNTIEKQLKVRYRKD